MSKPVPQLINTWLQWGKSVFPAISCKLFHPFILSYLHFSPPSFFCFSSFERFIYISVVLWHFLYTGFHPSWLPFLLSLILSKSMKKKVSVFSREPRGFASEQRCSVYISSLLYCPFQPALLFFLPPCCFVCLLVFYKGWFVHCGRKGMKGQDTCLRIMRQFIDLFFGNIFRTCSLCRTRVRPLPIPWLPKEVMLVLKVSRLEHLT